MTQWRGPQYPGDIPSLGYFISDWVARHCVVPDGFEAGAPFVYSVEQATFMVHHYRLRLDARPASQVVKPASAFVYRRSQLIRAQKWGKNPLIATQICVEAVGPAVFAGWAEGGEVWDCRDFGCDCGWVVEFEPGDPMGLPWPTPLIQVTATSEDQTDNTYDALRPMIDNGPLSVVVPKTGEEFIRLPGGGRVDVVTSNAQSRLGQRLTFAPQDQTESYTKRNGMLKVAETQRRGLAGMGGRAVEIGNAWDPHEDSVAQRTFESKARDVYRDYRRPPKGLKFSVRADRRKIFLFNYASSPWVSVDAIEAEAAELMEKDPAQAARFFGNLVEPGSDTAFDLEGWKKLWVSPVAAPPTDGTQVTLGFHGSRFENCTAIVGTVIESGFQWVVGIWDPADSGGEIPSVEVTDALAEIFERLDVWRLYADPPTWETPIDDWAGEWGVKRVVKWPTAQRRKAWALALGAYRDAQTTGELCHDGDPRMAEQVGNAHKHVLPGVRDDEGHQLWSIVPDRPGSPAKIDAAKAGCLSWEARGDAIAAGILSGGTSVYEERGLLIL